MAGNAQNLKRSCVDCYEDNTNYNWKTCVWLFVKSLSRHGNSTTKINLFFMMAKMSTACTNAKTENVCMQNPTKTIYGG